MGPADAGIAARRRRPRPPGGSRASSQKTRIDPGGRQNWSRFLWLMLGLLIVNWLLSSLFIGATSPTTISYSFFSTQVRSGNVQSVTSTGDTIQGTFRHEVAYPPKDANAQQVQQFTTQRPSFANDNLFQLLQASGATINANAPSQGPPLWEDLLLWFGPALLLAGLLGSLKLSGRSMGMGGLGRVPGAPSTTLRPRSGRRLPTSRASRRSRTR